jgi:hypothetical protein
MGFATGTVNGLLAFLRESKLSILIGRNGTGRDVTAYGDTTGAYVQWDESADTLKLIGGATIETDTINETTAGAGVTIDGVLLKDGAVSTGTPSIGTVAAAGTTQGTATALTKSLTYVTGADGTAGVILPASATGGIYTVYNADASNVIRVYPGSGDDINDGTANVHVTIPPKAVGKFESLDSTTWTFLDFVDLRTAQTIAGVKTFSSVPVLPTGGITLGSTTITEAEAGVLDSVTPGTAAASKALVLSAGGAISTITSATITTLTSTTINVGTAAMVEADLLLIDALTAGSVAAGKAVTADANVTTRYGLFATGGASTGAIIFSAAQDKWTDGQVDILSVFGASTADLTSADSAKCARFRHLVTGTALTVAHETYGAVGQLVVKGTTLTHLHAGLMGTFEGHTSGAVLNSSYTVGHAAIIARIGGHAAITATTPLAGFLAFNNGAAALAGATSSAAFATSSTSASYPWTYGLYIPTGSVTNGIDMTTVASGVRATVSTLNASTGRVGYFKGTVAAPNHSDGYGAFEVDITSSGTVAGTSAASSTWLNFAAGSVPGANIICVQNNGIWLPTGITASSAKMVMGMRMQYVADDGANPGSLFCFSTNISANVLTAIFDVNTIVDLGGSTGAVSTNVYKIPLFRDSSAGKTWYVNVYDG